MFNLSQQHLVWNKFRRTDDVTFKLMTHKVLSVTDLVVVTESAAVILVVLLIVFEFIVVTENISSVVERAVVVLLVVDFVVVTESVFLTTKKALYAFENDVPYQENDSKWHKWQLQSRLV